jgi:hypothetical protein
MEKHFVNILIKTLKNNNGLPIISLLLASMSGKRLNGQDFGPASRGTSETGFLRGI